MAKFTAGDRVGYAAKFLRNTGQFSGGGPQRRGTFVKLWEANEQFARVKWDDFELNAPGYAQQYGDDYVADARENGQLVNAANIAKVGSPRFVSNDL